MSDDTRPAPPGRFLLWLLPVLALLAAGGWWWQHASTERRRQEERAYFQKALQDERDRQTKDYLKSHPPSGKPQ